MSFIFYDTETTGTDPAFDQLLQFAAVRTDDELNVTDTFNIRCRLLPWVVPAPGAMLVTGVTPAMLRDAPLSYFDMMGKIHKTMTAWSRGGAVFLGWNSLRFDENFLRQSFYQSLLPVYLTVTAGNGRADAMRMAQFASIACPGSVALATGKNGKPTFRLGQFAEANGIVLDNAHEAMADTMATLAVARLVRQRAPDFWAQMISNSRKASVQRLVDENEVMFLADYFGTSGFSGVVTPIGSNTSDNTEHAFMDLQFLPEDVIAQDDEALSRTLAGAPKPIRTLRLNSQPGLIPLDLVSASVRQRLLPLPEYEARAARVRSAKSFRARLGNVLAARYPADAKPAHVEQAIFEGFPSNADAARMRKFHEADWARRAEMIAEFTDPRWREFAWRLTGAESPDLLVPQEAARWRSWRNARIRNNGDVPWRTVAEAMEEISTRRVTAGVDELQKLVEIEAFLQDI